MGEWEEKTKSLLAPTNLLQMIEDIDRLLMLLQKTKPEMQLAGIQNCQKIMEQEYEKLKVRNKLSNLEIYIFDDTIAYIVILILQLKDRKNVNAFTNQLSSIQRYYKNIIEQKRDSFSIHKNEIQTILIRLQQKYPSFFREKDKNGLVIILLEAMLKEQNTQVSFECKEAISNGLTNQIIISYALRQKSKFPNAYEFLKQVGLAYGNLLFKQFDDISEEFISLCDDLEMPLEEESYMETFSEIFAIVNDTDHNGAFAIHELKQIDQIFTKIILE